MTLRERIEKLMPDVTYTTGGAFIAGYFKAKVDVLALLGEEEACPDLVKRAIIGLKHVGRTPSYPDGDPHPLNCSLAGRVCQVFGVGSTRAHELCRKAGQDPDYKQQD